ncbi:MAG: NUDIX domain-containing protein [Polyangiales bacterium]
MAREPIPTWFFAMAVVRLGRRFLVVRERKHGQLWYLPAGRVEPGETFVDAAVRETLEESGVRITVEGLLRVEHSPSPEGARVRVFVVARPSDDTQPKTVADEHSLEARWVTLEELAALPLRGAEVTEVFRYVAEGGAVFPLAAITDEGSPWRSPRP